MIKYTNSDNVSLKNLIICCKIIRDIHKYVRDCEDIKIGCCDSLHYIY